MLKKREWLKHAWVKCRCGKIANAMLWGKDNASNVNIDKRVIGVDCKYCKLQIKADLKNIQQDKLF